jgi:tetratricopeptide (TPR) repeat protein
LNASYNGLFILTDLVWKGCPLQLHFGTIFNSSSNSKVVDFVKKRGNEAFVSHRCVDALRWYDMALDYTQDPKDKANIWSNKAASFLELGFGCIDRALECCNEALSLDPCHLKAVYRRVKALIALGRYGEADGFLMDKMANYSALHENEDLRQLRYNINTNLHFYIIS